MLTDTVTGNGIIVVTKEIIEAIYETIAWCKGNNWNKSIYKGSQGNCPTDNEEIDLLVATGNKFLSNKKKLGCYGDYRKNVVANGKKLVPSNHKKNQYSEVNLVQ